MDDPSGKVPGVSATPGKVGDMERGEPRKTVRRARQPIRRQTNRGAAAPGGGGAAANQGTTEGENPERQSPEAESGDRRPRAVSRVRMQARTTARTLVKSV